MPKEVVIALIGVGSSAFVAWLTARLTWRLEIQKWRRARDDIHTADLRSGLEKLILTISSAVHSMCWLTWLASSDPSKVSKERIDQYDNEMHILLPQLLGQHALVASLRPQTYVDLKQLIDRIFAADRKIGNAALKVVHGDLETVTDLGILYKTVLSIEGKIPITVESVLCDIILPDEVRFIKDQPSHVVY
jgi:hypothetical protein